MRFSVCMATYNGERFLAEQMASILAELNPEDEVVVVDDASRDGTWQWLQALDDRRLKLHRNERNRGVNASFARAIALAQGDVIFLADQDDRWMPGRIATFVNALNASGAMLASSNMTFMDGEGGPTPYSFTRLAAADSTRHWTNILRIFLGTAGYFGCAMAFRRQFRELILPFPDYMESHDLWMAMAGNLAGVNVHVESDTLVRRIHGSNMSVISRRLFPKLKSRLVFSRSLAELAGRVRKFCIVPRRDIL
jgi:glycosyltransferase involved in cell wall biosynthesis